MNRTLRLLPIGLFLLALTVFTLLPILPSISSQGRDSGIFGYTGWVLAQGGVPYRDAWDNKLPLVYYANAAAFLILGETRWAIWAAEGVFVLAGLSCFWALALAIRPRWGVALIALLVFALQSRQPGLIGDGNFSESYALTFQVMGFWAGYRFLQHPNAKWGFWLGLASGLALLARQNTVSFALAFIPALLIANHWAWRERERWRWLAAMIAGGLLMPGLLALYLAAHGALSAAYDATFVMPSAFHDWVSITESPGEISLLDTVNTSLKSETFNTMVLSLMPCYALGVGLALYSRWQNRAPQADQALLIWVGITFGLDLLVANVTNRAYPHYYITLIPTLAIFLIYLLNGLVELAAPRPLSYALRGVVAVYIGLIGMGAINGIGEALEPPEKRYVNITQTVVDYVEANTHPDDYVLVWGASTSVNFQSRRDSPTQYHYAYPLIVPGYTTEAMIRELVADLERNRPTLIVDSAPVDGLRVPPLSPQDRESWWRRGGRRDTADLTLLFEFVEKHCTIEDYVLRRIAIYRCNYPQEEVP